MARRKLLLTIRRAGHEVEKLQEFLAGIALGVARHAISGSPNMI